MYTTTTSTLVTEVVTNTPTTIELFDTRVVARSGAPGDGAYSFPVAFNRLIPVGYDPTHPDIAAAIAEASVMGGCRTD